MQLTGICLLKSIIRSLSIGWLNVGNIPCSSTRLRSEDGSKKDTENSCLLSSHTASADSRNFLRLRITRAYWVIDLASRCFFPADSNLVGGVPLKTEDTRDVTAFPDNEAVGQQRFAEYVETGPRPNVGLFRSCREKSSNLSLAHLARLTNPDDWTMEILRNEGWGFG